MGVGGGGGRYSDAISSISSCRPGLEAGDACLEAKTQRVRFDKSRQILGPKAFQEAKIVPINTGWPTQVSEKKLIDNYIIWPNIPLTLQVRSYKSSVES